MGQFDIVEEYTIDDNTVTSSSPSDITDFYVGTRMKRAKTESLIDYDEVASPSTYLWKKKLIIRLKRLSYFDINLWCKTPYDTGVHKLQVETGSSIKQEAELQVSTVMHIMGDGLHTGSKWKHSQVETEPDTMAIPNSTSTESTSQLIARANQLINKVSAALDITPDIPQQSIPSSRSAPAPLSNVETPAPFKRTVRCKLCSFSCDSVRGLNEHHKEDHGIVTCTICGKTSKLRCLWTNTCIAIPRTMPSVVRNANSHFHLRADLSSTKLLIPESHSSCANITHARRDSKTKAI